MTIKVSEVFAERGVMWRPVKMLLGFIAASLEDSEVSEVGEQAQDCLPSNRDPATSVSDGIAIDIC